MGTIKRYIINSILVFLFSNSLIMCQNESNFWYFGHYCGINFNEKPPIVLFDGQMDTPEGSAVICDVNGNLLFYSSGEIVWNREHNILPNGKNLAGGISSSQSCIIVPQPGNDSIFYLFTVDDADGLNGFRYSVVDLSLDNGFGDVIPGQKNIPLLTSTCEKVTAVKHADNSSVWVIAHEYFNNFFHAWLIDEDGFHPGSIRSDIGTPHSPTLEQPTGIPLGYMKLSQLGNKLAVAIQYLNIVEIFDFNNQNGEISNHIIISDDKIGPYGLEFSPGERYLYGSLRQGNELFQWDLEAADIQASRQVIGVTKFANGSLQLAPDGKIYLASYNNEYLGVINKPDSAGSGCDFVEKGLFLEGRLSGEGLPNMISSIPFQPVFLMENICFGDKTRFSLLNTTYVDSLRWNFNFPDSSGSEYSFVFDTVYVFTEPGTHQIELITSRLGHIDTIVQSLSIILYPYIPFGDDTTGCSDSPVILDGGYGLNRKYFWNNGSGEQFLEVNRSGEYFVRVSKSNCVSNDTIRVTIYDVPIISIDTITPSNCNKSTGEIQISVTGGSGNYDILWEDINQTGPVASNLSSGIYSVYVVDENGCSAIADTIVVNDYGAPEINIIADKKIVCYGDLVKLSAGTADLYEWSTGDSTREIFVTALSNNDYWVKGTNTNGCSNLGVYSLEVNPVPERKLGDNKVGCEGEEIILDAGDGDYAYLWKPYSIESSLTVNTSGTYSVTITDSLGCYAAYDVDVKFNPKPRFDLGKNRAICKGDTIILDPGEWSWYFWNTGEVTRQKIVSKTGNYRVFVGNEFFCEGKNEIAIKASNPEDLKILAVEQENIKCAGDSNGILKISAQGSWQPLLYSVNGGNNFFNNNGIFNNLFSDTVYHVAVMEEGACLRTGDTYIFEDPPALTVNSKILPPSCVECSDGYITLLPAGGAPPYTYYWWDFSVDDHKANLPEGKYSATITDARRCVKYFEMELKSDLGTFLYVPTAFTPNNDGINDRWEFKHKDLYPDLVVRVFDHYGKEVFVSPPGYPVPWDGTFNGSSLPVNSYFFFILLGTGENTLEGIITIIR